MNSFLTDAEFEQFRKLIYDLSGIHFCASNRSILESRLKERLRVLQIAIVAEYYSLILRDDDEKKTLLDAVTTNLTRFFRNTAQFETLEKFIVPRMIPKKRKGDRTLKIWSAGCSTGEEPYSIAMLFSDLLPSDIRISILASDLSLKSLMTAKEGYYPETRLAGMPEKYLERYCDKRKTGYAIKDSIKSLIRFDYHNLKYDAGHRGLDLVFCRNVLIYFDEAAQKGVINRFWDSMDDDAYLFIGHSESLFGMKTSFTFIKTDWACIYAKNPAEVRP